MEGFSCRHPLTSADVVVYSPRLPVYGDLTMGKKRPDTIKPDMSDCPFPGRSDPDAYNAWNREYSRRYRILNSEKINAAHRSRYRTPEYRAYMKTYESTPKRKAYMKAYYDNPEYKAKERSRNKIRCKTPEYKASMKKVEASRRQAKSMIPLTKEERQQLVVLEKKRIHLNETTGIIHHLDHIVPLIKGGIHHPINCRVITAEENMSKHDKMTPEAMALIPQIQAIVQERKDWIRDDEDGNLMSLLV